MKQIFTISEIAEKNGVSAKTVQNTIKENPQLGVVMKPRVKTILAYEQAAQISAIIGAKKSQFSAKKEIQGEIPSFSQNSGKQEKDEISQFPNSANESEQIAELMKQILSLTERAAKAEGQVEQLQQQVNDLKDQRSRADERIDALQADLSSTRGLLQTAEENAARAANRIDELRVGIDQVAVSGIFSRGKKAKALSAKASRMMLDEGE